MTGPAPIPPVQWLANDAVALLDAIVARHGGAEVLGVAGMEIALSLVRLHGDVRATTDGMTRVRLLEGIARLTALLPAPAGAAAAVSADGGGSTSDAAIALHVAGELTDEDLARLAAGLRAFSPSNECLAALVDENTALRRQLFDAQCAFGARDFELLNACLASVSGEGERVDLVERLQRDLDALRAEVAGLRGGRSGDAPLWGRRGAAQGASGSAPAVDPAPGPQNAPAGSPRVPGGGPRAGRLTPSEAPDCRPAYGPGQSVADMVGPVAVGPSRGGMFDNRGGA